MRHHTEEEKQRLRRLAAKRGLREAQKRSWRRERRRLGIAFHDTPIDFGNEAHGRELIAAPRALGLNGSAYKLTMQFLEHLRKAALYEHRAVLLDLRRCEKISPEIALLLTAELQRIQFYRGRRTISGISPTDQLARNTLHAMGFFECLGFQDGGENPATLFHIETGTTLDGSITERVAHDFAKALALDPEQKDRVQRALNEALENISEHAYEDKEKLHHPAEEGRWWICAAPLDHKPSAFLFACDLGATIPATIRDTARNRGPDNVAALANFLNLHATKSEQERLLSAAFEEGVTRRPDGRGGRGLGKMAELLQEFDSGLLSVWSGGAVAHLQKKSQEKIQTKRLPSTFSGTYVVWNLKQGAGQ